MINKDLYTHVQNTSGWLSLTLILGSALLITYLWYLVLCFVLI